MKKFFGYLCIVSAMLVSLVACDTDAEYITYNGDSYIMFSDTLYEFPVQNNTDYYKIPVVATKACDYDRTVSVEIVDSISNAIEGRHYTLKSNTITIKAGERVANVELLGYHDEISVYDSLGLNLRLVGHDDYEWNMYRTDANVLLLKACKFDINAFVGPCFIQSTFINNYMQTIDGRLTRSVVDPENENTIIIKDYFFDGYDVKIEFTTNDILNPLIKFEEQKFGPTTEAFGTLYGTEGIINMTNPTMYTSYYSSCEKFIFQYMNLYIPSMSGYNTVGVFVNAVEWISEDEAKKLKNEGY